MTSGLGHRIGPFELVERIASGRRTSLYRAVRPTGSRPPTQVAIRTADDPEDIGAAEMIRDEYLAIRDLHDPRIPRVIGFYAGEAALAITWVEGITLTDAAQAVRDRLIEIDPVTTVDILIEAGQALRVAHNLGRIHGHLGSQRIMLTPEGEIMILGIGVAARGRHPAYTAPEQAAGAFVDWRVDQWSLAAVGVELLLGARLYDNAEAPLQAAMQGAVAPWLHKIQQRAPAVARPLGRMLAQAAGDRYPDESAMLKDLMTARRELMRPSRRRALARQVLAFRDRLSVQKPPPSLVEPRPPPTPVRSTQPRPVDPPPRKVPVIITREEADFAPPPPQPRTTVVEPPGPRRRPRPVAPVRPPPPPLTDLEPLPGFDDPEDEPELTVGSPELEPTEALLQDDLEATELYNTPQLIDDPAFEEALIENEDTQGEAGNPDDEEAPRSFQPTEMAAAALAGLFTTFGVVYLLYTLWG